MDAGLSIRGLSAGFLATPVAGARLPSWPLVSETPDDLLDEAPLEAAVAALAERNAHHLAEMTEAEQADAVRHWRELALTVLTAARTAVGQAPDGAGPGRAVIVLEDAGEDEVAVHASFYPQLQPSGTNPDEVVATPAQATALQLLDALNPEQ